MPACHQIDVLRVSCSAHCNLKIQRVSFRTLAELNLPQACREVVEKDADAVLDEVEAAIYMAAATILRGEGFSYDVPLRTKASRSGSDLWVTVQTIEPCEEV